MVFGIRLNNGTVVAGDTIKGSIYFDISKEVPASTVVAVLRGEEFSKIRYIHKIQHSESHWEDRVYYKTARRTLVQQVIPISGASMIDSEGKIAAGTYVIPFEVQLPVGMPSSMETHANNANGSSCSIGYFIRAQIQDSGFFSDYKANHRLTVYAQPLSTDPQKYSSPPAENHVRTLCGCLPRGYILFGASVQDTLLDKGETVRINTSCRNKSLVDIRSLEISLKQMVSWNAESKKERMVKTLATVNVGQLSGLERMASLNKGQSSLDFDLKEMAKELEGDASKFASSLTMPIDAYDTFMGSLITIRHFLHITAKTGGGCMATTPEVEIPIQVGPPRTKPLLSMIPSAPPSDFDFSSATTASTLYVTAAHLGGAAITEQEGEEEAEISYSPTSTTTRTPTIENLLLDLKESVQDYGLIQQRAGDVAWQSVFQNMTPDDFGKLIQQVDLDFDEPKVAHEVASHITNVTCNHVMAVLKHCSEWNRVLLVEKLLPLTTDLKENETNILNILSDWDTTMTERAFKEALES